MKQHSAPTRPELSPEVQSAKLFSVDVFDTLLHRLCKSPTDAFVFMQEFPEVREVTADFAEYRIAAEAHARDDAKKAGQEDVTLDEIYTCFAELTNCTEAQAQAMRALELETEMALLQPTVFGKSFVDHIRSTGKRYVVTSDMYLPQDFIETALKANGIDGWDKVFVSNEIGRMKHNGTLFKDVVEHFGTAPSEILHIGDNAHADGKMALGAGLKSLVLPPSKDLIKRSKTNRKHSSLFLGTRPLSQMFMSQYLEAQHGTTETLDFTTLPEDEYFEAFGAVLVAPLMASMMIWMKAGLDRAGITNVAFLARDGMFPKAAFDLLYPERFNTSYIAASRRLLTLPFTVLEEDTIQGMFRSTLEGSTTLDAFLESIAAGPQVADLFEDTDLRGLPALGRKERKRILSTLKANPKAFYASFEQEREVLRRYYRTAFPSGTHSAVFDVGWRGSLQRSICEIIETDAQVTGFFFGTGLPANVILRRNGLAYESYSVSNGLPKAKAPWVLDFRDVVEFLCSADHGSVLRITDDGNGGFDWQKADVPPQEQTSLAIAHKIQNAALSAVADMLQRVPIDRLEDYASPADEKDLRDFLSKPHSEDAKRFQPVRVFVGVGDTTGESLTGIGERHSHYHNVKRSRWRAAYGAQLGRLRKAWVNFRLRKRKSMRI